MAGLWGRLFANSPASSKTPEAAKAVTSSGGTSGTRRRRVEIVGIVTWVGGRESAAMTPACVAHVHSGGGDFELVWLGRGDVAGVRTGTTVRARGVPTVVRGRHTIFNPDYDVIPDEKASR